MSKKEINDILNEYKKWLKESINIKNIHEELVIVDKNRVFTKNNIKKESKHLVSSDKIQSGISSNVYKVFSNNFSIPKLYLPCTIKMDGKALGIVGLVNVIWSNRRAVLKIYTIRLNKQNIDYIASAINDYIKYIHKCNINSVTLYVAGSNGRILDLVQKTNMSYCGVIPFGTKTGNLVESNYIFQHFNRMKKKENVILPDNNAVKATFFNNRKRMRLKIDLKDGFKLVSPLLLDNKDMDFDKIINGHINALQERKEFSIPLGEDKFIMRIGNISHGIKKLFLNYNYILLDGNNNYVGYINVIRVNAGRRNAEIEFGISPDYRRKGLATEMLNTFYDELFSLGFASVTSSVFEFNNASIKLHEKVADYSGIRNNAQYANGKLWDILCFTKVNPKYSKEFHVDINKKVIGIISSHVENNENPYDDYYKIVSNYVNSLDTNRVTPIALLIDDEKNLDSLDLCDGFIIQGGNKVSRYIYYIIDYAIKNNKPVLGICLGSQAIAIYSCIRERINKNDVVSISYLNKIYEQLEKEYDGSLLRKLPKSNIHNNTIFDDDYFHKIKIDKHSIAYDVFQSEVLNVPSFHNYDYKHIGSDFRISARAEDNVSEIIEYIGKPFIMGVHFHPEIIDTNIFNYFIDQLGN